MMSLEEARVGLDKWEHEHRFIIEEHRHCITINQPFRVPQDFLASPYYRMHRLKAMRCDLCHYPGAFKYLRSAPMLTPNTATPTTPCLVFLLCEHCWRRDCSQLPAPIDRSCYVPMHQFIASIENGLAKFRMEEQYSESIVRAYDFFENQLSSTIWQLIKATEKKRTIVCKTIFDEVNTLRQFYLDKKSSQIYDVLLQESECGCSSQCCYCDYRAESEEYLKANCQYFLLKKQQDQLIHKMHLMNNITSQFDGIHHAAIFTGINKELEMVIIQQMQGIEHCLNEVVRLTQQFSLINAPFLNTIINNYPPSPPDQPSLEKQSRDRYMEEGVLNHLTSVHLSQFSNAITSISLNCMPDEPALRAKLKMMSKLSSIEVGCSEVGELLVEDTIKAHQEKAKQPAPAPVAPSQQVEVPGGPQDIKQTKPEDESPLISLANFKELKSLSFNCNICYKEEFFTAVDLPNLEQVFFNWNFSDGFQKFNEASHFREDRTAIASVAPSPTQLTAFYLKGSLRNLWIGNCGLPQCEVGQQQAASSEINEYEDIWSKASSSLCGVMFGQFDARYRNIADTFYGKLNQQSLIKHLFFNKIQFNAGKLQQVLQLNTQIEVLYLNECEGITEKVIDQICELQHLRKLSIVQIKAVKFKKSIPTLEAFILERCFYFEDSHVEVLLQQSRLTTLSLFQCRFFEDDLLRTVLSRQAENQSELSYLNLGYTRITNSTLQLINEFPSMRSLHIGGTSLDLSQLLTDINHGKYSSIRELERLNMKDMGEIRAKFACEEECAVSEYYNDLFSNILEHFPLLSHLDISSNKVINERAIRFGLTSLAFLTVTDTLYAHSKDNQRVDHPGPRCPFANGRLDLSHGSGHERSNKEEHKQSPEIFESSFGKSDGLRIIF